MPAEYDARATEAKWRSAWERAECYRAPELPDGLKFFNYDSGPFPNGALHMGHVRTFLLGDVIARYQRLLGKSVLYCTEWDSFGLPNELEAMHQGISPRELTRRWIGTMTRQMKELGISYDGSRIRDTSDPSYYRWTQWLFLRLLDVGLVERREAELPWCPRCSTVLSHAQVEKERCWRCGNPVERRVSNEWFVAISRHSRRLLETVDHLEGWSEQARKLFRTALQAYEGRAALAGDWLVSRQRSWGTPIPMIHCPSCGTLPVPETELPVLLPEDLDWSLGPRALAAKESFVKVVCPVCGGPGRRETDTLDCFFDDMWCFLACLVNLDGPPGFRDSRVESWMPVDCFHSGFDTVAYLPLHRFLGAVLYDLRELRDPEPLRGHIGHDMVLHDGRKMSKHLGNAISPSAILRRHGADALRVGMLWAAAPGKSVHWRPEIVDRAVALLNAAHALYRQFPRKDLRTSDEQPSKGAMALRQATDRSLSRIASFIEDYRPNAAVEELALLFRKIESFVMPRIETARLLAVDESVVDGTLGDFAIALSPFAPHLAEELWALRGETPFIVNATWPRRRT